MQFFLLSFCLSVIYIGYLPPYHAGRYAMLLSQKSAMEDLETTVQKERDKLEEEMKKNSLILAENQGMRGEIDR